MESTWMGDLLGTHATGVPSTSHTGGNLIWGVEISGKTIYLNWPSSYFTYIYTLYGYLHLHDVMS